MKFLCDQMLGTLTKWLRFFGFDTFYVNSKIDDEKILSISDKEKRIIITRDKILINKARRKNLQIIAIDAVDLDEQLIHVLKNLDIDENAILSRCSICNSALKAINKREFYDKIPEKIFDKNETFWLCKKCDKIYWKGSHYDKIIDKINNLKKVK